MRPPRCGASPSCSPLWRRYRDEYSTSDVRPRRRFYDDPERAGARVNPPDRPGGRGAGARPAGGLGRGLRPVGPVAASQGPGGRADRLATADGRAGGFGCGPLRPCAGPRPHGRLHRPGHAAGADRALGGAQVGPALAGRPAAGGPGPKRAGVGDTSGPAGRRTRPGRTGSTGTTHTHDHTNSGHQGPHRRAAGGTALPHPYTSGRPAGQRGDRP